MPAEQLEEIEATHASPVIEDYAAQPGTKRRSKRAAVPEIREGDLLHHLRDRFPSNRYALLTQVPNATGATERRWADAVAFGLWPSRGLDVHGVEVKVSRSDWISELKDAAKAEEIGQFCDYWWLAVHGERGAIVHIGDLPSAWGLIRWHRGKWVVDREAPKRKSREPGREFVAAILRRAQEQMPTEAVLKVEYKRGRVDQLEADDERVAEHKKEAQAKIEMLQGTIDAFEKASGIEIGLWESTAENASVGQIVRLLRERGAVYFENRLRELGTNARAIADHVDRELGIMEGRSDVCECTKSSYRHCPESDCKKCGGSGVVPRAQVPA